MKIITFFLFGILMNTLTNAQNVGIGTTTPNALLHLRSGSAAASPYFLSNLIIESSDRTYLQMLTPVNKEAGLMFGNANGATQGGIYYNNPANPEGLDFRTNGNVTRMEIDNAGNVEMKAGLIIKGNLPSTYASLVSKDNMGTTTWQKASAFKADGLLDEADVNIANFTVYKLLFNTVADYNIGLTYAPGVSEYTVPVKGIYYFDVQVRSHETQNISTTGSFTLELMRKRNSVTTVLKSSFFSLAISGDITNSAPNMSNQLTGDFLLEPNDIVWVQCLPFLNNTISGAKSYSSFSGRLITQLF